MFSNIRTVRAFSMEPKEAEIYGVAIDNVYENGKKKVWLACDYVLAGDDGV